MTGLVVGVIALGLDDHSSRLTVHHGASDQVTRHLVDRAVEEVCREFD
jgi:hypothetical protein